jgi:hypothetical protein
MRRRENQPVELAKLQNLGDRVSHAQPCIGCTHIRRERTANQAHDQRWRDNLDAIDVTWDKSML